MATADHSTVVAVAAEAREFAGLLRHASAVSTLDWPLAYSRRALIGGAEWLLTANGPGPKLAGEAAQVAIQESRPRAVVSTGFCGALDPQLAIGSVFVATEVHSPESRRNYAAHQPEGGTPHLTGVIVSQDRVASTQAEKSALRAQGARAVEMEAAAVAQAAERSETDFYCVRVVSDGAVDELPLDFNLYRGPDGRFSRGRIAAAALARPWIIPGLLRFEAGCRRAATILGDFLANCRFQAE